jgi:hypothetical protein
VPNPDITDLDTTADAAEDNPFRAPRLIAVFIEYSEPVPNIDELLMIHNEIERMGEGVSKVASVVAYENIDTRRWVAAVELPEHFPS